MVPSLTQTARGCTSDRLTPLVGQHHQKLTILSITKAQTDPDFLRINTYLTQKVTEDMIHNIVLNDVGSEFDALTSLRSRTQFGRPDFPNIFNNIRNSIETGQYLKGRESSLRTNVGGELPLVSVALASNLAIELTW